ncbi:hypothetical protein ACFYOK_37450 [Microbispora bryophytorum]|uniref:hypothetical protein n=1 Tax=Microbispora bryophytorum TaxID=1460882 RepID=UPI0033D4E434
MAEPTPVMAMDGSDPWLDAEPGRRESLIAWLRENHVNAVEVRRLEVYDLGGQWFARTQEYTPARRWGRLYDPVAKEMVIHQSTYVLNSPPPQMPQGGARG